LIRIAASSGEGSHGASTGKGPSGIFLTLACAVTASSKPVPRMTDPLRTPCPQVNGGAPCRLHSTRA